MTTVSLYVELKAKAGKEEDVARFLAGARDLVAAEPGTIACVRRHLGMRI